MVWAKEVNYLSREAAISEGLIEAFEDLESNVGIFYIFCPSFGQSVISGHIFWDVLELFFSFFFRAVQNNRLCLGQGGLRSHEIASGKCTRFWRYWKRAIISISLPCWLIRMYALLPFCVFERESYAAYFHEVVNMFATWVWWGPCDHPCGRSPKWCLWLNNTEDWSCRKDFKSLW